MLACALLKLLPQFEDAVIKRTRDTVLLDTCDVVVDVGGVYDPTKDRYDHHQRLFYTFVFMINHIFAITICCLNSLHLRTFQESFSTIKPAYPFVTRLSSAGMYLFGI